MSVSQLQRWSREVKVKFFKAGKMLGNQSRNPGNNQHKRHHNIQQPAVKKPCADCHPCSTNVLCFVRDGKELLTL